MKNWTLRELLLLVTVCGFVLFHVGNALRLRVTPLEPFEITNHEMQNWAAEIDPQLRFNASGSSSGSWVGVKSKRLHQLTIDTDAGKAQAVIHHWRQKVREKIDREGWSINGTGGGTEGFSYSLWKLDSLCDFEFFYTITPIPVDQWNKDKNRVRLESRRLAIGYTRLRDGKQLIEPSPAAP